MLILDENYISYRPAINSTDVFQILNRKYIGTGQIILNYEKMQQLIRYIKHPTLKKLSLNLYGYND